MCALKRQKGFTIVELMVAVTIIGTLSAIGIPRALTYVRTATTAEISQDAATLTAAIGAYAQTRIQTAAATATQVNAAPSATPDLSGTTEISTIIPEIQVPKEGHYNYMISAAVATGGPSTGDVVYCILATGRANAAVPGGKVLYSSAASANAGWDGHVNRTAYVNGLATLTGASAGGYCSATGTATAAFAG